MGMLVSVRSSKHLPKLLLIPGMWVLCTQLQEQHSRQGGYVTSHKCSVLILYNKNQCKKNMVIFTHQKSCCVQWDFYTILKTSFLYVNPHRICQQDLYIIAQLHYSEDTKILSQLWLDQQDLCILFMKSNSFLRKKFFFFFNRGGKRVRTAAKTFLGWFQSTLSRIS